MEIEELLIATGNQGKFKEFTEFFKDYNIKAISTKNFNVIEPEETGQSFKENAIIKAESYAKQTNCSVIADDSGLCVDQLDDKPGIYSARWAGKDKNFVFAMKKIKQELLNRKINLNQVTGYFICILVIYLKNGKNYIYEGRVNGKITFPPKGDMGFGYDPIFIPNGYDKTFAELSSDIKQEISHRAVALEKMKRDFLKI